MRDREEPLDQRQPAVEVARCVRVDVLEVQALLLIGRRIAVVHEREVETDTVREALKLHVPVEPPPRILPSEQDHQQRPEEQQPARTGRRVRGAVTAVARHPCRPGHARKHDEDRDDDDEAERRRQPVEWPVRIVDRELHRVCLWHGRHFLPLVLATPAFI